MTSNVPSLLRTRPLKPWIGWSANGGVTPLIGAVPSAAPLGSLPGRYVSAGSEAKFVNDAWRGVDAVVGVAIAVTVSRVRPTASVLLMPRTLCGAFYPW